MASRPTSSSAEAGRFGALPGRQVATTRRARPRALAVALLCATPLSGGAAASPLGGDLRLERAGEERFRAEYCLDAEVTALRFERPVERLRTTHWSAADEAFALAVAPDGTAELARRDGAPFTCAALALRVFTERPEADYYAFSRFGDGGVALYTGYLLASARAGGEWRATGLSATYSGRPGERITARAPGALVEQFVYFGPQVPAATGAVTAIVDPAMPASARDRLLGALPAVDALLTEAFGFRPSSPYQVFVATELEAFDGYSIKGGALSGQILFTVKGREAAAEMKSDPLRWARLAAHEVIHLWQTEVWFGTLGDDHPWVHEGSAEALAIEALRRAGVLDGGGYELAWRQIETDCAAQLESTSVHAGPRENRFDVVYPCGALVNRLAGELVAPEDPGGGLVRLWRALADSPEAARRGPSEPQLFVALAALGVPEGKAETLRALLEWSGARTRFEERLAALRAPRPSANGGTDDGRTE